MVGIAGSAVIGDRVILAAGSGVGDHVTIGVGCDACRRWPASASNVAPGGSVDGIPAMPRDTGSGTIHEVGRLKMLYPKVDDLKKRVEALEKGDKGG